MKRLLRDSPAVLLPIFFVSGFAALVYQVLWVRELGLLFGSTAQAAALTIAIFFAGIAGGGWYWGRRAARTGKPLRLFGWLEVGVAISALGHFVLVDVYHALYPALFGVIGGVPALETLTKAVIAASILLLPAFLMGGTLPLMVQHMAQSRAALAHTGAALYAVNTAGSASGALAAGFVLPVLLGFHGAYLLAVGLDIAVGLCALFIAAGVAVRSPSPPARPAPSVTASADQLAGSAGNHTTIWLVAFFSGAATLGVEVVWTRLFSQVLQNSVYTYALVLSMFLIALAVGAVLARWLAARPDLPVRAVLAGLLIVSAVVTVTSPWLFYIATAGLGYIGGGLGWWAYIGAVASVAAVVMLIPGIVLGAVLPYLLRMLQARRAAPGDTLGRLVMTNTLGAIVGTLVTGFVLLGLVGTGHTLLILGSVYLGLAILWWLEAPTPRGLAGAGGALVAALAVLMLAPSILPHPSPVNTQAGERLVALEEGAHATVAVIERDGHLLIRVNGNYILGGTGALESERNQSIIPLMTHPAPASVFYLGMGTGITAGAALDFPVRRVVVCEILPEVVRAAGEYFGPWTNGLFSDPRVTIHAEDGRNCLSRSREQFDVIISDLFTPWKAGTGNLYTLEHYRTGLSRLRDGGIFVQWIPLYQVSERELAIIARTMDEVFPQVLVWRGDLFPDRPILALVGQQRPEPLDPDVVLAHARRVAGDSPPADDMLMASVLRFYAGNLGESGLFGEAPLNTDNRPRVEYLAPRTHRQVRAGEAQWMNSQRAAQLYEDLIQRPGVHFDPYLAALDESQLGYVIAGRSFYHHAVLAWLGREDLAQAFLDDFLQRTPFRAAPAPQEAPATRSGWD